MPARWASHSDASKELNCGYEKIGMVLELFMENLGKTAKLQQEVMGVLSLRKFYLTSVLVFAHGKVSTNKHKAVVQKYGHCIIMSLV